MSNLPFDAPGRFWRGNLHTHSNVSDGAYSPEEVCKMYQSAGYDFIALTEHFMDKYGFPIVDTRPYRNDEFTTILGAELHGPQIEFDSPWHIVADGLPLDFQPIEGETGPEIAQRAIEVGAFVTVAHPQWYTLTEKDIDTLEAFHAIEVYNGVAAEHNDRADSWHIADIVLSRGTRCNITAADDFHAFDGMCDFQRGWVWVKAEDLSPEALLAALKNGQYYSSTGPQIHDVAISQDRIASITCSPAERVYVTGRGPAVASQGGRGLTQVQFDLSEFNSPYARITVRDAYGNRAWTNPFWFDEL